MKVSFKHIVRFVAEEAGLKQYEAEKALRALAVVGNRVLGNGDAFTIPDFGVFRSITRPARSVYVPKTGEHRQIKPKKGIKFSPSKQPNEKH